MERVSDIYELNKELKIAKETTLLMEDGLVWICSSIFIFQKGDGLELSNLLTRSKVRYLRKELFMEKSTIKRIIECAAGSCASFATGVVLGRFMPEAGLAKKVIFSIGSVLIGGVVGDMVSNSSAVTEVSDAVANALVTSKNDISEEAKKETTEEVEDETSEEVKEDSVETEKAAEETGEDGYVYSTPTAPSFVKSMSSFVNPIAEGIYSGMEIWLTILTSKRLIKFFKIKKLLPALLTIFFAYGFASWIMELVKVNVYDCNKEAIA